MSTAVALVEDRTPLSADERAEFEELEKVMRGDRKAAERFHSSLLRVYEGRLYRQEWANFEVYCRDRWGIAKSQGYRQVEYGRTVRAIEDFSPRGDVPPGGEPSTIPIPSETAARELSGLAPDAVAGVWGEAVALAGAEGKPATARHVREARKRAEADDVQAARDAGIIPEGAEVVVEAGDAEPAPPPEPPRELTDAEYLDTCPARAGLADHCRKWFDAEALAFRKVTKFRLTYGRQCKPVTNEAKRSSGHIGPWASRHSNYLRIADPTRWAACKVCSGTGRVPVIGQCGECRGHGYHV